MQATCQSSAVDPGLLAGELRDVVGRLVRRLRAESPLPLTQTTVLGRLDREGAQSVSDLAAAERVRPQSMAQTVGEMEVAGLVQRRRDPSDGRRALVFLSERGAEFVASARRGREGWLARMIAAKLTAEEQALLRDAAQLLHRLADGPDG